MQNIVPLFLWFIFAYLTGSISTAIIICKIFRLPDPRSQGSGNPGATNVLRFGGKKMAALVLAGDFLKGLVPVLLAKQFLNLEWSAVVGICAVLGHIYPLFYHLKGGKGVATSGGVLLGLYPPLGGMAIFTWCIILVIFRYSSLAAILTVILVPLYACFLKSVLIFPVLLISIIILYKHHVNIKKLFLGKEPKIGKNF